MQPGRLGETSTAVQAPVTFIVGAMRSGTTLMRLILARHSTLAIPPESHFLARLFRRFSPGDVLAGETLDEAVSIVSDNPEWRRDWQGDPDALRARATAAAPLGLPAFIDLVFRLQIEPTGKARWGDKTPAYLFQVPRLRACFPHARFVAMVRDPRDAYLSLVGRGWVGTSTWQIGNYLLRCDRLVDELASDGHGDVCVVRYEDLVADTETTLHRVCRFLDLEYEPAMRDFHVDAEQKVQPWELESGVHQKLLRPMRTDDLGRWRHELARTESCEVEAVARPAIERFGYPLTLRGWQVPVWSLRARARHHLRDPRRSWDALRARARGVRVNDEPERPSGDQA